MTRHDRIVGLTTIIIIVSGLFFVTDRMTQGNNSSALNVEIEGNVETTPPGTRYPQDYEPIMSIPLLNDPVVAAESTKVLLPRTDDR